MIIGGVGKPECLGGLHCSCPAARASLFGCHYGFELLEGTRGSGKGGLKVVGHLRRSDAYTRPMKLVLSRGQGGGLPFSESRDG